MPKSGIVTLERCHYELARIREEYERGNPDQFGLCIAWEDWMMEEMLIVREGGDNTVVFTIDETKCDMGCSGGQHYPSCAAIVLLGSEWTDHLDQNPFTGEGHKIRQFDTGATRDTVKFDDFCVQVRELLSNTAKAKGYNTTGPEGPNMLFEFNARYFPGHALGEVIYKCVRYSEKKNLEDVLKAAAWLFLVWKNAKEGSNDAAKAPVALD